MITIAIGDIYNALAERNNMDIGTVKIKYGNNFELQQPYPISTNADLRRNGPYGKHSFYNRQQA